MLLFDVVQDVHAHKMRNNKSTLTVMSKQTVKQVRKIRTT